MTRSRRSSVLPLLIGLITATTALAAPPNVEALFEAAKRHYDQGRLDEASALFERLVREHPDSPLAEQAANLSLDSLNMLKDWSRLLEHAREFRADDRLHRSARFTAMLEVLIAQSQFKIAEEHLRAGRFAEAAALYGSLVGEQPSWESADAALFNAAICFERAKDPMQSIAAYERLVELYPKSELAERGVFAAAVLYERLAYFDHAAKWYRRLSEQFPHSEHAASATLSAAILNQAAGRHGQAVELLTRFSERHANDPGAASALRWAGDILHDTGEADRALATYREWLKRFGASPDGTAPDEAWTVRLTVARILLEHGDRHSKGEAQKALEVIVRSASATAETIAEQPQQLLATAAEAAFLLAEPPFNGSYQEAIRYHQPSWTIAALYRLGQYEDCVQKSHELAVYSTWTKLALIGLHKLEPKRYPGMPEIRPEVAAIGLPVHPP